MSRVTSTTDRRLGPSKRRLNLLGQRFGLLVVNELLPPTVKWRGAWRCTCDCGNTVTTTTDKLRTKRISSCGCDMFEKNLAKSMNRHEICVDSWSKDDLSYAAGFVDGEGCLYATKSGRITITASNTYKPVVEWLCKTFGGCITGKNSKPRKSNHRRCYAWQIVCGGAAAVCRALLPFLKVKREQAELILKIHATAIMQGCRRGVPASLKSERIALHDKIKELKRVAW